MLFAVLLWQLPRIIEALRTPAPSGRTVTTEMLDDQGRPYTTTTFTSFESSPQVEVRELPALEDIETRFGSLLKA